MRIYSILVKMGIGSLICCSALGSTIPATNFFATKVNQSRQLLLIISDNWNANSAEMQRYERPSLKGKWVSIGDPMKVGIGKNGMAWSAQYIPYHFAGPYKQEGDLKTPAGIFKIGPEFGFADQPINANISYQPLLAKTLCVDDQHSVYYNQLIDAGKISKPDWQSAEQMRSTAVYKIGAVIDYNMDQPIKGGGSCIFMHILPASKVTAGCVALPEQQLMQVLDWLDERKNPLVITLPAPQFKAMQSAWKLPVGEISSS